MATSASPARRGVPDRSGALLGALRQSVYIGLMITFGCLFALGVRGEDLAAQLLGPQPWSQIFAWTAGGFAVMWGLPFLARRAFPTLNEGFVRRRQAMVARLDKHGLVASLLFSSGAALSLEILFRGGLQPTVGAATSAALFGVLHLEGKKANWIFAAWTAWIGLCLGALYAWSGLLWASIFTHMAQNVSGYILVWRMHRGH